MQITRLYLRNYRVYEGELDLEIPPGLVGVYGPNGAGKSVLLESIRWTLFGRARTDNTEVRTAGVLDDCVTEVQFEHEGHLYVVRRTLKGTGKTPATKAEAFADNLQVAEGPRDTARYVHSVLGMDDASFKASVFAEQKQIDAFTDQTPGARKKLVLQLLGITPLDDARDMARRDHKDIQAQFDKLREALLPVDVDQLRVAVDDAAAASAARAHEAAEAEAAASRADAAVTASRLAFERLNELRQEYDLIVQDGKAARADLDRLTTEVGDLESEQQALAAAAAQLAQLQPVAGELPAVEARLRAVDAVIGAASNLAAVPDMDEPAPPDEAGADAARAAVQAAATRLAEIEGRLAAARDAVTTARDLVSRSADLSTDADCPVCGQALGDAFEQVQHHRADELTRAEHTVATLAVDRDEAAAARAQAETTAARVVAEVEAARRLTQEYAAVASRRAEAQRAYDLAVAALGGPPAPDEPDRLRARLESAKDAADGCARLRGRLERGPKLVTDLESKRLALAEATGRVETLRDKLKGLGHDPAALDAARVALADAEQASKAAVERHHTAAVVAGKERANLEAKQQQLADAEEQHAKIAAMGEEARYLGRLADLLHNFRNGVVAKVGPMLEHQAGALFAELTDHEYDGFEVDPESYEIKLRDGAGIYGMRRFSGSETDLANLALRVAISEHVRFQSGGSVGLLVLDEVFGPLDDDRRERMLLALERLKARFRQVLVVTHASDIKEQLPNAIEVVKLPGRRATARVLT